MGRILKLVFSLGICLGAGFLGTFFTLPAIPGWYASLNKPFFNPPNWLFGPVWTVLYILMAVSLWLIWQKGLKSKASKQAVRIFGVQLFLNAIWTPIFFGAKNLLLALAVIVLLWFLIRKTVVAFGKINKKASSLLYPYFAWVSFALILNFSIWLLNL